LSPVRRERVKYAGENKRCAAISIHNSRLGFLRYVLYRYGLIWVRIWQSNNRRYTRPD